MAKNMVLTYLHQLDPGDLPLICGVKNVDGPVVWIFTGPPSTFFDLQGAVLAYPMDLKAGVSLGQGDDCWILSVVSSIFCGPSEVFRVLKWSDVIIYLAHRESPAA